MGLIIFFLGVVLLIADILWLATRRPRFAPPIETKERAKFHAECDAIYRKAKKDIQKSSRRSDGRCKHCNYNRGTGKKCRNCGEP